MSYWAAIQWSPAIVVVLWTIILARTNWRLSRREPKTDEQIQRDYDRAIPYRLCLLVIAACFVAAGITEPYWISAGARASGIDPDQYRQTILFPLSWALFSCFLLYLATLNILFGPFEFSETSGASRVEVNWTWIGTVAFLAAGAVTGARFVLAADPTIFGFVSEGFQVIAVLSLILRAKARKLTASALSESQRDTLQSLLDFFPTQPSNVSFARGRLVNAFVPKKDSLTVTTMALDACSAEELYFLLTLGQRLLVVPEISKLLRARLVLKVLSLVAIPLVLVLSPSFVADMFYLFSITFLYFQALMLLPALFTRSAVLRADREAIDTTGDPEAAIRLLEKTYTVGRLPRKLKPIDRFFANVPPLEQRAEAIRSHAKLRG